MTASHLHFTTALSLAEFRAIVATILASQPTGTALVCADGARLTVDQGELFAYADDALDVRRARRRVDARSWDPELGCFYGESVAHTWRHLTRPQYCHAQCASAVVVLQVRDAMPGEQISPADLATWSRPVVLTPERINA